MTHYRSRDPDAAPAPTRGGALSGELLAGPGFVLALAFALSLAGAASAQPGGAEEAPAPAPAPAPASSPAPTALRGIDFPIAVWLQNPRYAARWREAGINLYVGLWKGPTEEQLARLKEAGMPVVCAQNEVGLAHRGDPTIVGWMHGDEPDNAQRTADGKGWGPPIPPEKILADYRRMRERDPTRPVMLNLGQGVAWDGWRGRGVRSRHSEDYPLYQRGGDIVSFDIYPVVHRSPEVSGKLEFVARGVERLVGWTGGRKPVWCCIECTRIQHPTAKPTPRQVRAEVWMAIARGARGIIWFVHQWRPRFDERALLHDPEMLAAVRAINRQVRELAPVIAARPPERAVKVAVDPPEVPLAMLAREHAGALWIFAVTLRSRRAEVSFDIGAAPAPRRARVLGEERSIDVPAGQAALRDRFAPYDVHLYRIDSTPPGDESHPPEERPPP